MENNLINSIAKNMAFRLSRDSDMEGTELKKMVVGIEIFLLTVSKLFVIYTLAIILDVVFYTLVIQGAFTLIKRYSLGLHALSSTVCTVVSCFMFVIMPWLLRGMAINNATVIGAFAIIILCLHLYAPADTKARPLIGKRLRASFKRKAIISGILLMGASLLMPSEAVKFLLTTGAAFQVITILPITYKILKRSVRNYETYERSA
jgi:accessory gene regulator B